MEKLGEEILFDILLRLPIPSLIQFKCINKKWLSLISDRQFVRAKLKRSLQEHPISCNRLLLASNPVNSVNYEALAEVEANSNGEEAITELDYPVEVPADNMSIIFIGSCDGLVCLLLEEDDDNGSFILWNPTTRESRILPKPTGIDVSLNRGEFYGFGYDSFLDDYKLLVGKCDGSASAIAQIFSLNNNSWKQCEGCCHGNKVRGEGIYFHGSLHWLSSSDEEGGGIVSFGMREERFQAEKLPLPPPLQLHRPDGLGVTEDCLFVYQGENSLEFKCWILKEYGVGSSWSLQFQFSTESLPTSKYWTRFIGFTRNGKIVFDYCGWEICIYDPERRTCRCFQVRNDDEYFESCITYVESLVSTNGKGVVV